MNDSSYQYALDKNNNAVFIDEAASEEDYFCPFCHEQMIPKNQSENWSQRYFVHGDGNESKRHRDKSVQYNVKWFLYLLMEQKKSLNEDIYLVPMCPESEEKKVISLLEKSEFEKCTYGEAEGKPVGLLHDPPQGLTISPPYPLRRAHHFATVKDKENSGLPDNFFNLFTTVMPLSFKYPLIEGADEIFVDKTLGKYKPKISLFKEGKPFKVIEILLSTNISEQKMAYYIENKIDVITIYVRGFPLVERIQKSTDYLPLSFVSVTINRDKNEIADNENLVELENHVGACSENYLNLSGKSKRIQEILDAEKAHIEGMRRMPKDAIDKMKSLAQQICDICSQIEEIAEENGVNPDDFENSPLMIEMGAEDFIAELNGYDK